VDFPWAAIAQSVQRLATGWTVRGSNPGGGEIFRSHPDRPWGLPSLLYNRYRVSFPGVKRPGRGVDHPPLSSAEVKERVELYLYSPSGPSWPVIGINLPLPFKWTSLFPDPQFQQEVSVKLDYMRVALCCVLSIAFVLSLTTRGRSLKKNKDPV
jgi:hypothetical protein